MTNFTLNPNEMKREINNLCKQITIDVNKARQKFVFEMIYGIARQNSCRLADIARALKEDNKLFNTIDRLSTNMLMFNEEEKQQLWNRYHEKVTPFFDDDEPIVLLDDSDVAKRASKKLEDLDEVIDASSKDKEIVPGYHVCEAVVLGKRERQPISLYSKIYSCKSDSFESKKTYTLKSIDTVREVLKKPATYVADRGYDDDKIYTYLEDKGDRFVIRLKDRNLLFKGKSRNIKEVAKARKGKVCMSLMFQGEQKKCYLSYTKVRRPKSKNKEYTFIVVYGLNEEEPMMLLTNREINNLHDLRVAVRLYFSRWRIEEYFRAKKQEYRFEKYMIRTLEAMNIMNMLLTFLMGYLGTIAERINEKLLGIKLVYASQSLVDNPIVWLSQLARGLGEILYSAKNGIQAFLNIEHRRWRSEDYQLSLFN